ncbi:MAG: hypothetical protein ABIY38_08605, partial [Rhodococcus sp. (in: high G+C Gram-positive bacteria)]
KLAGDLMSEQTVGIRFRGESQLTFCGAGIDIRVGDWVIVRGSEGEREGCVVVTADQLVFAETESEKAQVLRKVVKADLLDDAGAARPTRLITAAEQIGFGGPGHPSSGSTPEIDSSIEDDIYRTLKSRFPRLGDLVLTDGGEMLVVGVNMRTSTLTVRQPEDSETRTITLQDVLARTECAGG